MATMSTSEIIAGAITKAGGVGVVAKAMAVTPETIRLWRVHGRVPSKRLVEFERVTGTPREQLSPELYERA